MKYLEIAKKIIALQEKDLALRQRLIDRGGLGEGYNGEMQVVHNENAQVLCSIMDMIGYPTQEKVGEKASQAAWLVIQHAIGDPVFMRKCAALLLCAVDEQKGSPIQLAYLSDRIAVFEGKKQRYGTQFDWDETGVLNPQPYDNKDAVNQRRASLGLNTLEEQTVIIRERAVAENELPPKDWAKRKQEVDAWKQSVGWTQD